MSPGRYKVGRSALLLALLAGPVSAAVLTVAPGGSIQAALDRAAPGDTVEVARGFYRENLRLAKPLTLRGVGRPTLSGGNRGDTIRIAAPDVRVEGFIVRDSGDDLGAQNACVYLEPGANRVTVRGNDLSYCLFGLWIEKVRDARVENNLITGKRDYASVNRGNGIQLYNTEGAAIVGNRISFVRDGIYVDVSHHALFRGNTIHDARYGTHYMNSYYNRWEGNEVYHNRGGLALMEARNQVVVNNHVWGNSDHGIMLRTLQDSVVADNVVAGNARGLFVYDAEYNTLRGNLVIGNQVGVHLSAGSVRNVVTDNDFIANREQIRYVGSRDEEWGPPRGNHWSDYLGWDRDGDGRGDVPYQANDLVDRLLWRYPAAKLLLNSPAVQSLRLIARQFPLLRAPSVLDPHPAMRPNHPGWAAWSAPRYRFTSQ